MRFVTHMAMTGNDSTMDPGGMFPCCLGSDVGVFARSQEIESPLVILYISVNYYFPVIFVSFKVPIMLILTRHNLLKVS